MATGQEIPWFRELYDLLIGYVGEDCYADVLLPWIPESTSAISNLSEFKRFFRPSEKDDAFLFSLWNLYALSRVIDFLLLSFQSQAPEDWRGPHITIEDYTGFFEQSGLTSFTTDTFSSFRHEIVEVVESDNNADPIEILEHIWPGLMFGNLLFSRSGVRVCGGREHVVKEVAERSTLYFTYRRLHRRTEDLSMGWGSNSQWRTGFRRDYECDEHLYYNVDGDIDLTTDAQFNENEDTLSVSERIELCKNRSFIVSKRPDADLWYSYDYRFRERQSDPLQFDRNWLSWNSGVVRKLAQSIRDDQTFHQLPILGDALEDAGCLDEAILKHCREPNSHGPRCWVVEHLLGE